MKQEWLSNVIPLSILAGYIFLAATLTTCIVISIVLPAYRKLPSSSALRRPANVFMGLAMLSLGLTWYYMITLFIISYRSWAKDKCTPNQNLDLGEWLRDTSLFRDAWEIVIEKNGRFWWSQQIFLCTTSWSVYIGIQGRQRNIPYLWAFMLLGQIVAISFSQNLFFLAVLLSPKRTKVAETSPSSAITVAAILATYVSVLILPVTTGTGLFIPTLAISHIALFFPIYFPPAKLKLKLVTLSSFLFYAKQTLLCIWDSDSMRHLHRDYNVLPTTKDTPSFFHHPAVSSVGWDVLLCAASLIAWDSLSGQTLSQIDRTPRPKSGMTGVSWTAFLKSSLLVVIGGLGVLSSITFES